MAISLPLVINVGITILFSIIGIAVYLRMKKYISNELRVAPKHTFWQKFSVKNSAFIFSIMIGFSVVFVLALISSTIAANSLFVLQSAPEDGPDTTWLQEIVRAFQFPIFLPFTLFIITIFAFFYPLYEYIGLARPGQEGAMEIQRWMETNIIERRPPPFSYFRSLFLFILIVLLPPSIISIYALRYVPKIADLPFTSPIWVIALIFFVWFLLGPVFYLSYYSNLGLANTFFRGRRMSFKKDKLLRILYIFAILSIISSIWSFGSHLTILWGDFEMPHPNDSREFIRNLLKVIEILFPATTAETKLNIRIFFAIVPIDFVSFMFTTAFFGLFGFYTKFVSKEPLNTPKMVFFAAYIICGIAFTIFFNAMIKWPWLFPDDRLPNIGLNLILQDPQIPDNPIMKASWFFVVRLFSIVVFIEKTLNTFFLITFFFIRKEIRHTADEWVLNKAIYSNDFSIIQKYKKHDNPEMRKLVANALGRYAQSRDSIPIESSKYIVKILEELLVDKDPNVRQIAQLYQNDILLKLHPDALLEVLIKLISKENLPKITEAAKILMDQGKKNIQQLENILNTILLLPMPSIAFQKLLQLLHDWDQSNHSMVYRIVLSLLHQNNQKYIKFILEFIKGHTMTFSQNIDELSPFFLQYLQNPNSEIVAAALDTWSSFTTYHPALIPVIMPEFNKITTKDYDIIRQKIGVLVKFTIIKPDWFQNFFDYFEIYLKQHNPQILSDAAVALGSLSSTISTTVFYTKIFPYLKQLVQDPTDEVRKATLASLIVIAKTRQDIYREEPFQHLFSILIIDDNVDIRHHVYSFFIEGDPQYLFTDIAAFLKSPLQVQVRIDLLNILTSIAGKIIPFIDELGLIDILCNQPFEEEQKITLKDITELQEDKSHLFGFHHYIEEINVTGATLALLFELLYYMSDKYVTVKEFISKRLAQGGDIALAKMIEFYGRIALDELQHRRTHGIDIDITKTIDMIFQNLNIVSVNSQEVILHFIETAYPLTMSLHQTYFEILTFFSRSALIKDPPIRVLLLQSLIRILAEYPQIYFNDLVLTDVYQQSVDTINPFSNVIRPYLIECLEEVNPIIQYGIASSLRLLIETTPQEDAIRSLLLEIIKNTKDNNILISTMQVFIALPMVIEDETTINILLKRLGSKNTQVKAQAIRCLGSIVRLFPQVSAGEHSRSARRVRELLFRVLYHPYSYEAPMVVKEALVQQWRTMAVLQPFLPLTLSSLQMLGQDPVPAIAKHAIETFFQLISAYPQKSTRYFEIIRQLSNNSDPEIHRFLMQQIIMLYQAGIELFNFYPSLVKLATSYTSEIRIQSLETFKQIYLDDVKQIPLFRDMLLNLTHNKTGGVRKDATTMLIRFLLEQPSSSKDIALIIQQIQKLTLDYDHEVRLEIVKNLNSILRQFPQTLNDLLYIVLTFLRRGENDIIDQTALVVKYIWNTYPALQQELLNRLKQFHQKSINPIILTLMEELKRSQSQESGKKAK